ncbi:MAG: serine/threonine protein kinase, partial [Betaproteobacteria bacterium]
MEAPNALPAGHALQEYRIEKVLGVGGFGLTYLALDENLHLRVAVKEYLPADIALRAPDCSIAPRSEETVEIFDWGKRRFLDESRTLASFRHPNIVRVMRFFEANGTAYMVMEFVEGAPLPDWV